VGPHVKKTKLKGDNQTQQLNLGQSNYLKKGLGSWTKLNPRFKKNGKTTHVKTKLKGDNKTQQLNLGQSNYLKKGLGSWTKLNPR
jgi:hypothetical protein